MVGMAFTWNGYGFIYTLYIYFLQNLLTIQSED